MYGFPHRVLSLVSSLYVVICLSAAADAYARTPWHQLEKVNYSFEHYIKEYGKKYASDEEFHERKQIFHANLQEILEFNRQGHSWKMGVNQFTDHKDEEKKRMSGYRIAHTHHVRSNPHPKSTLYTAPSALSALPESVDWRQVPGALTAVKDQASCGSCWAFSTSEVLESFYFLKNGRRMLVSPQQIASCTEIPRECWGQGKGGCFGSTQVLAYHAIMEQANTVSEYKYPYLSASGSDFSCVVHSEDASPLRVEGYKVVKSNSYEALMSAVANEGPVAISVDASNWSGYEQGIFTGCVNKTITVDHAIQLVGYGSDQESGLLYWIVRNSWATTWGEHGFMRLLRSPETQCVQDPDAADCLDGPKGATVCGDCGILYDSSFPIIKSLANKEL